MAAFVNAEAVEGTTDDVVTDTGKVADTTTLDQNHRVFLEVMTFTADVGGHFLTVGQTNTGDLTQSGVRLLGCTGSHLQTDTATLGASTQRLGFALLLLVFASETHQLVDCRHKNFLIFLIFMRSKTIQLHIKDI